MQNKSAASKLEGFGKIQKACQQAINDGLGYVWVDTCCINKESSAELSEAVNSMYRWYEASELCYAFLSDVDVNANNGQTGEQQMYKSIWFTRGWTLQELLAPRMVSFYDHQWTFLGTKQTLRPFLTLRTGIYGDIILGEKPLSTRSIAQRMSWASRRVTTRVEDVAYCLLGIFDVNMPLLYGEGKKAFLRLQQEIIKESDDHSIFAWPIHLDGLPGLLAESPAAFQNCQVIWPLRPRQGHSPYPLTNRGLSMKFMATPFATDIYLVPLDCVDGSLLAGTASRDDYRLGIFLMRLHEDDQYARVEHEQKTFMQMQADTWELDSWEHPTQRRPRRLVKQIEVGIRQNLHQTIIADRERVLFGQINGFRIAENGLLGRQSSGLDPFKVSAYSWSPAERIMSPRPGKFGTIGLLDISQQGRNVKLIELGFDFDFNPVCFIAAKNGLTEKTADIMNHNRKTLGLMGSEEQAQWLSIYQRTPFDTRAWSETTFMYAQQLEFHSGLWALKGDRVSGIHCILQGEDVVVDISRQRIRNKGVWIVHISLYDGRKEFFSPGHRS